MRLPALALLMLCVNLVPTGVAAQSDATPPLPDRNPMRPSTALAVPPKPPKPPLPGEMPTEPWTDAEVTAAKTACSELLASVTADYQPLPPIKEGICGAPAPVLLRSIGKDPKVVIDPPATVTCPMVKELSDWLNDTVQPEAKARLDSTVVGLHNATAYACRNRYGGANTPLSEHALANALDVSEFVFASGARVTVLDSWPKAVAAVAPPPPTPNPTREQDPPSPASAPDSKAADHKAPEITKAKAVVVALPSPPPVATEPPVITDPKSLFLKHVHDAACNDFGTVLGPEANEAHKNHFHLDMKKRRSGYCDNGSVRKP